MEISAGQREMRSAFVGGLMGRMVFRMLAEEARAAS
jgi:hypothetical protein